jgi:hypothetical protein
MWQEMSWGYMAALWPQQAQLHRRREKVSNHPFCIASLLPSSLHPVNGLPVGDVSILLQYDRTIHFAYAWSFGSSVGVSLIGSANRPCVLEGRRENMQIGCRTAQRAFSPMCI